MPVNKKGQIVFILFYNISAILVLLRIEIEEHITSLPVKNMIQVMLLVYGRLCFTFTPVKYD
jgi:hypothetical protein